MSGVRRRISEGWNDLEDPGPEGSAPGAGNALEGVTDLKPTRRSWLLTSLATSALAQQTPAALVSLPRKIRLGIIGFDGHVGEILGVLPQLPDVKLAAVAGAGSDPDAIASSNRNPYVQQARRYDSGAAMLSGEKLDVVAVCNNDGDRAAAILGCCAKGIHTIAEKPLAINRPELDAVYSAVKKSQVRVGMLLPMRFDPPYLAMKRMVASGIIGEALQIDAQKSYQLGQRPAWQKRAATYGSTILWIGIHMIDLMTWVSGRRFTEAASYQNRVGFPELRDMQNLTATLFRLDNGGTATLRMDYLRPSTADGHGDDRLRIAGTRGIVEFQEATGVTLMSDKAGLQPVKDLPAQQSVFVDFLQAVYAGARPALSWNEIVQANEFTLAAHEAATQHQFITIPNPA